MADTSKWVEGKVVGKRVWTDVLFSLQIEAPVEPFRAGQFGKLALAINDEIVSRPYSYVNAPDERPLEFYFIVINQGPLSPRLAALEPGDAAFLAPRPSGLMTLADVRDAETLWLLSTGTAVGPFLSILKTAEPWQRFRHAVLVHAVRHANELAYREQIDAIAAAHAGRFSYLPFVSREDTGYAIRGRVPEAIRDGRLEARTGRALTAEASHVMICGNPDMVRDTTAALEARGMRKHKRKEPGHITIEAYW
ncbi:MAG: ferredoxin--NADP reductase [Betaproteobacteria bacterium]|nr:ferredoxin--NADP reductase [Betaproteobacteria bacterium]